MADLQEGQDLPQIQTAGKAVLSNFSSAVIKYLDIKET